jgi:quercetin dioxygenase-like cupin family protein
VSSEKEKEVTSNLQDMITRAGAGERTQFGGLGFIYHLDGSQTDGRLSVVEHPIEPRSVAAPMHTHTRQDEFSFVTRGEVTFQLADEIIVARPGDFVVKPRGIPHAFWNAGDEPCSFLELISPAGFENFFRGIGKLWDPEREPDIEKFYALAEEYDLKIDMTDAARIQGLIEQAAAKR